MHGPITPQGTLDPSKGWWSGWRHIVSRDPCVYCNSSSNTVEHVHPAFLRSGDRRRYYDEHIVGACQSCNADKGGMSVLLYLVLRQLRTDMQVNAERRRVGLSSYARILRMA